MARILVLNNYSFERVWQEVRAGIKPDHHLFGLNYFAEHGYEVEIAPFESRGFCGHLQSLLGRIRMPIPLGDLSQQRFAYRLRNSFDLIYAPSQTQTQMLGYLKLAGLWKKPVVCIAHHPFDIGRLAPIRRPFLRAHLRGIDRCLSLSQGVATEINGLLGKHYSEPIPWGPQKDFYPINPEPGEGAIAAGRTGRDFITFGQAATQARVSARIVCLASDESPGFNKFGPTVQVESCLPDQPYDYRALMEKYSRARVMAIPLAAQTSLAGLTSLNDALGMGKPVIVTRNRLLDLDVEKLGIGFWVEPGDVAGWADKLKWFETHPHEALAMGKRARSLVDGGLNSKEFAKKIVSIFDSLLNQQGELSVTG